MLASSGPLPTDLEMVAAEPKWDGLRLAFYSDRATGPRLVSRTGRTVTGCFPEVLPLSEAFAGRSVILDGELIVAGEGGHPDFYALSRRLGASRPMTVQRLSRLVPVTFMVFDVLWLDDQLLTQEPYVERRQRLVDEHLTGPAWQTTPSFVGAGVELLATCVDLRLEGVVLKRLDRQYAPGLRRRGSWIKIKCPEWRSTHESRRRPPGFRPRQTDARR
jgi:bifunctional non-homologous end joining protein LigD